MQAAVAFALVGILTGCGGTAVAPATPPPPPVIAAPPPMDPIVKPVGYVEVRPTEVINTGTTDGMALLLLDEGSNRMLPVYIGGTEGHSIMLRLRGEKSIRPLTHDLLDDVVKQLRGEIVKVQVDELRHETGIFHGSIYIRSGRRVMRLDARPSDAIALAIGNRIPIYCAQKVLDEAGVPADKSPKEVGE